MLLGGVVRSHVAKTRNIYFAVFELGDLSRAGARFVPAAERLLRRDGRRPLPTPGEPAPDHRRPRMGAHGVIRRRLRLERQPGVNLGDGGGDALAVESACVLRRALRAARCGCLAPGCEADAMLEGDGGHIKELYRRGQAHEQLGTDRLGLAMKDYTRLLNMWNAPRTRLAPSAGSTS